MSDVTRPRAVSAPELRLIVFHHAGGSAFLYHPLARVFPPEWDVLLLDLPGRGRRRADPLVRDMPRLLDDAVRTVTPYMDVPYALFGHSMGSVVAVETGRRMASLGAAPRWVGVSGRAAPSAEANGPRLSLLPNEPLSEALFALGGTPSRVRDAPDLQQYFLRLARADLEALDSYEPEPGRSPLPCPLTAFGGTNDPSAPPTSLVGWAAETASHFRIRLFPGGHFYLLGEGFPRLGRQIIEEAEVALGRFERAKEPSARIQGLDMFTFG